MAVGNNKKMDIKKKILFLVTQSEFGGAQRFIYRLVNGLDLIKYEIVVCAGPEGNDSNGLLFNLKNNNFRTIALRFLRRGINPLFDLLGFFEIKKLLKKEKPDILFLCSSKAGFLGSWAGHNIVKRIIYRIGGWSFNDPRNFLINLYFRFLERFSAKWKDYIINNADSDRQQAIKLGIKPRKEILTIYNGIDVNELEFLNKEEGRSFLKLKDSDFVVGAIANDYPTKGLKYLREVEKKLQNIKFVILSGIPNAYRYLKAFDAFILPSVKEGFPWVILEAMVAEVPIIATKVGALPEIIQNNENGILIEPKNPKVIIDAIKLLQSNDDLRIKLAINGKKMVIEKFNLEKMIQKYEDLFSLN
jgi:glycosyltransferase involved in cell wall biosynthesis